VSLKSLESLSLSPHMTAEGLKELPALPNLKSLGLNHGFPITDSGMKAIAQIKSLEFLSLQGVSVTPAGIKNLNGLKLKTLSVYRDQITDEMLKVLHEVNLLHTINWARGENGRPTGLKDVRYINLAGSRVTDAGLRELEGMTSLVEVFLEKTKVTDEGISNLKKALPKLQVSR
jgi:internalin A